MPIPIEPHDGNAFFLKNFPMSEALLFVENKWLSLKFTPTYSFQH